MGSVCGRMVTDMGQMEHNALTQNDCFLLQLDSSPQYMVNQRRQVSQRRALFQAGRVALVGRGEGVRPAHSGELASHGRLLPAPTENVRVRNLLALSSVFV